MPSRVVACSVCNRVIYEEHGDAHGRCVFCAPAEEPAPQEARVPEEPASDEPAKERPRGRK